MQHTRIMYHAKIESNSVSFQIMKHFTCLLFKLSSFRIFIADQMDHIQGVKRKLPSAFPLRFCVLYAYRVCCRCRLMQFVACFCPRSSFFAQIDLSVYLNIPMPVNIFPVKLLVLYLLRNRLQTFIEILCIMLVF